MTSKRFQKKLLKVSAIILGFLLAALVGFHFWFKANARQMIEDLVESRSNGKIKLKVEHFSFNWFSRKMEFRDAVFYSTDSATANTSYSFHVEKIKLKVQAILPIVFKKRILIDTITLLDPNIQVTRNRAGGSKQNRDISLPEEMGKVYNSIQDALKVLKVSRFLIENGVFTLVNKVQPDQQPIIIDKLRFQVDNLQVDTTILGSREKILFSDNVILQTHDQDILFPDGRHRLSFSKFRINLQQRLVEFDSCTIAATRKDSSAASFSVFMDALKLIDIDFDTLYTHEVIKADSVYCVNPRFDLEVELGLKKAKAPPKLENIIKQLTGDLQLENVVVNNASFNIKTIRDGVPGSFTSTGNNFEMQGLSIDQQLAKPLKVRSFVMAIRNYENFLKDSTYSVQFDSVLFRDDRIFLSNFLFQKMDRGRIINTFRIPQFYLGGLSWDDLVFENRLKAEQATMFYPEIIYTVSDKLRKKRGQNIFQSLAAVNDYMDIEYLDIVDGSIDLTVNKDLRVQLEEATLAIQSHNLLTSTRLAGIKNSLTELNFKKGIIHAGGLLLNLKDIHYLGKTGKFGADEVLVSEKNDKIAISLQDVAVEKMIVDEQTGDIHAEDISWEKGVVKIIGIKGSGDLNSLLELKRVKGRQTLFTGTFGNNNVSAELEELSFAQLDKNPGGKLFISGLRANGKKFKLKDESSLLSIADFSFEDKIKTGLRQISYHKESAAIKADISVPSLNLVPHFQSWLDGDIKLNDVQIEKPVIDLHLSNPKDAASLFPKINVNDILLNQPSIQFSQASDSGLLKFQWKGDKENDILHLAGIQSWKEAGFRASVDQIDLRLSGIQVNFPNGKKFDTQNGKIVAGIKGLSLLQKQGRAWDWDARVTHFQARDFVLDSIGKNDGRLEIKSIDLIDLGISTASIVNMKKLAAANNSFQVNNFTGSYANNKILLDWRNARLLREGRQFSLNSFSYRPRPARDSFTAQQEFQSDYITLRTGAIRMGPVDIDTYINDNILNADKLLVNEFYLSDYRDNSRPFKTGVIKPLPVDLLKKIPIQFSINTIRVENANVDYTQVAEKTKMPATIPITNLNVQVRGAKNYNFENRDSLDIIASANIVDSGWVRIHMRQSYLDPMGGFLLGAQFKPANLVVLNPVLVPLSSVKIQSGWLDTAYLTAVGAEWMAYGEMKMNYHDLKVKFLKARDGSEKGLSLALLNFFANSFAIRNKNTNRTGIIFFNRDRERSVLNYLVNIAMSGINSSIGAKNNKKQLKKYEKDKNLSPLPLFD